MSETTAAAESSKKKKKLRTVDIAYIGLFAALIAVCAQIAVPMTVSFTMQTFAVCLCAGLLGWKRSTVSVIVYILLGMVGLPIFTGFKSGVAAITGPTGGYIVGFVLTALITGALVQKVRSQVLAVDPVYGNRPDCMLRLWHRVVHHCLQSHIKSGAGHLRGAIPAAGVRQDPAGSPTYQSADSLCKINLKRHKETQGAKYTLRFLLSYTA